MDFLEKLPALVHTYLSSQNSNHIPTSKCQNQLFHLLIEVKPLPTCFIWKLKVSAMLLYLATDLFLNKSHSKISPSFILHEFYFCAFLSKVEHTGLLNDLPNGYGNINWKGKGCLEKDNVSISLALLLIGKGRPRTRKVGKSQLGKLRRKAVYCDPHSQRLWHSQ